MRERAQTFIESLVIGLFHRWEPDRLFMFLTAYVDESGTHGAESPRTILAGHVAESWQWRDFEVRWLKLKAKYGLSQVHAKDIRGRHGEFAGWSSARQSAFVNDAHALLQRRTKFGFEMILNTEDYERFYIAGFRPRKIQLDSAYGLCFRQMLSWLSRRCSDLFGTERVRLNIVMEAGHHNMGDVDRIFARFLQDADPRQQAVTGTVTFAAKSSSGALEAADMLAYVLFREERQGGVPATLFTGATLTEARLAAPQKSPLFRLPLEPESLREIKQNVLDQIAERQAHGRRTPNAPAALLIGREPSILE